MFARLIEMLKEKSGKKRLPATETAKELTLDARHQQFMDKMAVKCSTLESQRLERDAAQEEVCAWRNTIKTLAQEGEGGDEYNVAWTSNLYWQDRFQVLERGIKHLESAEEEIDYFESTGGILFQYYNLLDHQDMYKIEHPAALPLRSTRKKHGQYVPTRSILEALTGVAPLEPKADAVSVESSHAPQSKQALVEAYLSRMDPTFLIANDASTTIGHCPDCKIQLTTYLQEGIMVCHECGHQEILLVEQNKPIHRQPSKDTSHYSYKRINHFNEWLSQCQGQESTDISDEIFERILAEIKKEKLDVVRISFNKMKEILKKLKYNKYYEHIYYIIYRINGIPAPKFSQELEEKLRSMFKEIQAPFLRHCPSHRVNFLSYGFVIHKFLQLLDKDEYSKYFHLLKSREKLHAQDQVWQKICSDLEWQFIKSI